MSDYSVVGKSVPRIDAVGKVTGSAVYSGDISLPGMLHGKVYRSPFTHARIRHLNVAKAREMEGVMAVITADDIPVFKNKGTLFLGGAPRMAREKVVYEGQPVAAVAATSISIAEKAISLIEVDYEELPAVIDITEAIKPDTTPIHTGFSPNMIITPQLGIDYASSNIASHLVISRGDIDAGFKEADVIVENTYRTQKVHHGFIEPMAAMAAVDNDGRITVWTQSQGTFRVRQMLADYLDMPLSRINVVPVEIGGAFGGKNYQPVSPLCALLALKSGHPVRIEMTREEVIKDSRPAPESVIEMKVGVSNEGEITAISAKLIFDSGAFLEIAHAMFAREHAFLQYKFPNLRMEAMDVFTNKVPSGFYRSPAMPQVAFALESQLDLLSREIGMDPLQLRIKNVAVEGDVTLAGDALPRVGFKETLERMAEYLKNKECPAGKNRGRGIACGAWRGAGGNFGAFVSLNADGSVNLLVGVTDISGSCTSIAQIVAEEFCLPIEAVHVTVGDTDTAPWAAISVGSMVLYSLGVAAHLACQDAKAQLAELAATELGVSASDIEFSKGLFKVTGNKGKYISLSDLTKSALGFHGGGPVLGRGSTGGLPPAPTLSVHAVDCEVDEETGKVRILAYTVAADVGRAINPIAIEGQIEGAIAQGIGWALMESYVFKNGVVQNPNLLDYRIPTALDVPPVDIVMVEVPSDRGVYGLRHVGEPPNIPTPAAVANAIHSAIGVRLKELPMTPETVFQATHGESNT